jgi:hypothetical protein
MIKGSGNFQEDRGMGHKRNFGLPFSGGKKIILLKNKRLMMM